ncbi:MAG TPA: hypothetical protein VF571_00030 [Pyrinomonadaceae bacterium]|jgi:hypothetical protein
MKKIPIIPIMRGIKSENLTIGWYLSGSRKYISNNAEMIETIGMTIKDNL